MRINSYNFPKSSFLSIEKDMNLIVDKIFKNERLKKLLYYTSNDCLTKPDLTQAQTASLFGNQIRIVPNLTVNSELRNYLFISFDDFTPNASNPEFKDNHIYFDIICHVDQWHLNDFALRPYKIAAEIDSMFNDERLTGIGRLAYEGTAIITPKDNNYVGLSLAYLAIHGEEDKKDTLNPADNQDIIDNFNNIFNSNE